MNLRHLITRGICFLRQRFSLPPTRLAAQNSSPHGMYFDLPASYEFSQRTAQHLPCPVNSGTIFFLMGFWHAAMSQTWFVNVMKSRPCWQILCKNFRWTSVLHHPTIVPQCQLMRHRKLYGS